MKNYQLFTFWWFKSLYPALTNMRTPLIILWVAWGAPPRSRFDSCVRPSHISHIVYFRSNILLLFIVMLNQDPGEGAVGGYSTTPIFFTAPSYSLNAIFLFCTDMLDTNSLENSVHFKCVMSFMDIIKASNAVQSTGVDYSYYLKLQAIWYILITH